jgi:hypothetical protein
MSNKVSLNVVLGIIDQTIINDQAVIFSISYVKLDGSRGHIERAQKSVKLPSDKSEGTSFRYNLKKSGNLLLFNVDSRQYRTIKISLITHFNGIKVRH